MKWTPQQQAAITSRGSDLLVAAAAGSGKTAVLVERICALVREGIPIDRMLIVTFTNAAAAEMRTRIASALEEEAEHGNPDLARQSMMIEHASISTLHRFCITVLRTYFYAVHIDPTFRTGNDSETQVLRNTAMEEAIDACFDSADSDFEALCACFRDDQLANLAFSVYHFMMAQPKPWDWLAQAIAQCTQDEGTLAASPWIQTLLHHARIHLSGTQELLAQMQCITEEESGPIQYAPIVQSDAACIDTLLNACQEGYSALQNALSEAKFARLPGKSGSDDKEATESFKALRKALKDQVKDMGTLFSSSLADAAADITLMVPALRGLQGLLRTFHALYTAQKTQRNLLDYNDLEHLTLQALEDDAIADALRDTYEVIFVDEYQDSNAIQETLLHRIAHPGGMFYVGDVKQSIYGFRQAEPSLFLEKYARFSKAEDAPQRKIDLNQNFRSRKNVLASVNTIFSTCMREDITQIHYDEDAMLYYGLDHPDSDSDTQVLLLCSDADNEDDDEAEEDGESLSRIEKEALLCAKEIRKLVGTKEIYDTKRKEMRTLQYRDMAILLRAIRLSGPRIVQILAQQGIPAYCDAGEGYFDMPEVRQVLCLLQIIDNELHDDALLAVLRGNMLSFDDETLAAIRIAFPEESFSAACRHKAEEEDDIALSLRGFFKTLHTYRLYARYFPLDQLITTVMNESGIYARAGALPGGEARQSNLRLLCDRAREFQSAQGNSLGAFLLHAEKLRAGNDNQTAKLIGENENVVRIMTMHKSKGLEFPVVFLLNMGQRFNFRAQNDALLLHPQLGIGALCYDTQLRSIRPTLSSKAIKEQNHHEALSEELRILYVAMTRARDMLYILGSVRTIDTFSTWDHSSSDLRILNARTPLDILMPPLVRAGAIPLLHRPQALLTDEAHWQLTLLSSSGKSAGTGTEKEALQDLLATLEKTIPEEDTSSLLSWKDNSSPLLRQKTSVSQLLREGESDPLLEPLHPMPQFMEQSTPSGASRGIVFHTVMREIDFSVMDFSAPLLAQIEQQLDAMEARQLLTVQERQLLAPEDVEAFLTSPLGVRMTGAKNIKREWPFNYHMQTPQGNVLVQGIIDCCFKEGEGWILLDFKTDRSTNTSEILSHYRGQIDLYAKALESITGNPVKERYLYLTRQKKAYLL